MSGHPGDSLPCPVVDGQVSAAVQSIQDRSLSTHPIHHSQHRSVVLGDDFHEQLAVTVQDPEWRGDGSTCYGATSEGGDY